MLTPEVIEIDGVQYPLRSSGIYHELAAVAVDASGQTLVPLRVLLQVANSAAERERECERLRGLVRELRASAYRPLPVFEPFGYPYAPEVEAEKRNRADLRKGEDESLHRVILEESTRGRANH